MTAAASAPDLCAWCTTPFPRGTATAAATGRRLCDSCGVSTIDPWPTVADLDAAYAGAYRPASGRFSGGADALLRWSRSGLAKRIDAVAPPGPLLDIGSGDGALVDAVRRGGRSAVGLERSPRGPNPRFTPGPGMDDGMLDDLDESFAVIVIWHALEHLRAPGRTLERAASLLAPGGVLIVAVPNADSLQARVFGDRWFALDPPRHLVHIPANSLIERLRAAGLEVERTSHWRGGQIVFGWLHGLVGALPGTGDLYDALRRPQARQHGSLPLTRRAMTIGAGIALAPVAAALAGGEILMRRGGSVYVEARRV